MDTAAVADDTGAMMVGIILWWEQVKVWLSASTGLTHHDFHLLLGVLLTLGFTRLLRLPLGAWTPLGLVLGLELVNETFDYTRYAIGGYPWTPGPTLVDIALTIGPPLAIVLAARWDSPRFRLFRRRPVFVIPVVVVDH